VIIHRPRPVRVVSLLLAALVMVPFALVGGLGAWMVAIVVWVGVVALLVRRYRDRGKGDNPPRWVV
jgi:uncharacterized membrane protein YhaH (DUF805 family)